MRGEELREKGKEERERGLILSIVVLFLSAFIGVSKFGSRFTAHAALNP
jgi:hypothetical protein